MQFNNKKKEERRKWWMEKRRIVKEIPNFIFPINFQYKQPPIQPMYHMKHGKLE
jgi:hypothetical protein